MIDILAKRYAKALFFLGQEDGLYRAYGSELDSFSQALKATGEVGLALTSPFYAREQRRQALLAILEKSSLSLIVANFVKLLFDKGRLNLLEPIKKAYLELCDEREGLMRGTLTTAAPLTDSQVSAIKGALNIMSGAKVELEVIIDDTIIGGLVARLGDLVVDSSIKTQLKRLSQKLAGAL
ncbi:MAG: ATP synthase F1 subunit delta [Deltaproteobacteria bacterium]|jgi:F-type H+-transporting ATPase subunit delta|nr:ATP synthase F1 subunit delta [Deltaproteobacteria bacterium]